MMTPFGGQLRAERERRGLSLDLVHAETKVSLRHLQALEEEHYAELPRGVFRRGIVRAYLRAIGLDEQPWLPRFEQSLAEHGMADPAQPDEKAWATFATNVKNARAGTGRRSGIRWWGVLLLLVLVAAAGFAVWQFVLKPRLRL